MQFHWKLILFFPFLSIAALVGARAADHFESTPISNCVSGDVCYFEGTLSIFRGVPASVGELEMSDGCVPLALSESIYISHQKWDSRIVRVEGIAFLHGSPPDVIWYMVKDRKVSAWTCESDIILYVDKIALAK